MVVMHRTRRRCRKQKKQAALPQVKKAKEKTPKRGRAFFLLMFLITPVFDELRIRKIKIKVNTVSPKEKRPNGVGRFSFGERERKLKQTTKKWCTKNTKRREKNQYLGGAAPKAPAFATWQRPSCSS